MRGELVVDGDTKRRLLGAETVRGRRLRLLDEAGNLFGEFVKITPVADAKGDVYYVEGDGLPSLDDLKERSRLDLRFTTEQVLTMLQRITEELIKGPPKGEDPPPEPGSEPRSGGSR